MATFRLNAGTAAALLLAAALWPASAQAHLASSGLGPIYDGIQHALLSAEDLVPVLALALLAGQNGAAAGRRALVAVTLAWLTGGVAGFLAGNAYLPARVTTVSFLLVGGLVAAERRLAPSAVAAIAAAVGLLHGWLNGAGIAEARREVLALAGIVATVAVVFALAAALVTNLRAGWERVAVRVAGSWVAAIGLLLAGWALRGG